MADFSTPLPQATAAVATGEGAGGALRNAIGRLLDRAAWTALIGRVGAQAKSFFNPLEFSRPASQSDWLARVSGNASRFSLLYACLFAPILVYTMLSSWWLVLGSTAIGGLWFYAYGVKQDTTFDVFGIPLPKVLTCAVVTILVMLISGMLNALIGALFVFSFVGMPHMSLHTAPGGTDAIDSLELQPVCSSASASS
jgi:hypothetical protein